MDFGRFSSRCLPLLVRNGSFSPHRHHGAVLFNYFTMNKCGTKLKLQNLILCNRFSESAIHFPWRQNFVDPAKEDPVLHKLFGMILLRRVLKNYSREEFDLFNFFEGVKIAIQALSDSIRSQDREGNMIKMLGSHLHDQFRKAFDEIERANQEVVLELKSSRNFKVIGVRAVCGSADPGDEYCINILGQKVITSKHDMFELEKRASFGRMTSLFNYGKQLGFSAAEKQLRFQLDVKFESSERYFIKEKQNGNGQIIVGNPDIISTTHNIRLETLLGDTSDSPNHYPFSWRIIDIDFRHNENDI